MGSTGAARFAARNGRRGRCQRRDVDPLVRSGRADTASHTDRHPSLPAVACARPDRRRRRRGRVPAQSGEDRPVRAAVPGHREPLGRAGDPAGGHVDRVRLGAPGGCRPDGLRRFAPGPLASCRWRRPSAAAVACSRRGATTRLRRDGLCRLQRRQPGRHGGGDRRIRRPDPDRGRTVHHPLPPVRRGAGRRPGHDVRGPDGPADRHLRADRVVRRPRRPALVDLADDRGDRGRPRRRGGGGAGSAGHPGPHRPALQPAAVRRRSTCRRRARRRARRSRSHSPVPTSVRRPVRGRCLSRRPARLVGHRLRIGTAPAG
jgi:hypothetical protein